MKAAFAILAVLAVWSAHACACVPVRGYRIPSNFELVEKADLIVLALVKSGPADLREQLTPPDGTPPRVGVTLTPVQVLKGHLPSSELRVSGLTTDRSKPVLPAVTKLTEAHPSSFEGACIRFRYPVGGLLIAMFENTSKGPAQLNYPFARQIEDVEGNDGVWVRAVRLYVSVLAQPAGTARRAALSAAERSLRSHRNDPGDAAIAADIRSYLHHQRLWTEPGGIPG